jgi:probable F420-dependent oxidoreductase
MKLDRTLRTTAISAIAAEARELESSGYDGIWTSESQHDPFLPLVVAAEHTQHVEIGTAIAVAFARNPMSVAYTAADLQHYSGGRFVLGLGTQVKPHVERRFGMPWSSPAARMRDFIEALRAIWTAWESSSPLDHRGEFYSHTLMLPFFSPPVGSFFAPRVFLAAVGDLMTEVAGGVADGLLLHPFTTTRYLLEVTTPALEKGATEAGRTRADLELALTGLVVTGRDEAEMALAATKTKEQLAFYGSTKAYRRVLDLHGWSALADQLATYPKATTADQQAIVAGIDDEVLDAFAVRAEPDLLGPAIQERFGSLIDRWSFYTTYPVTPDVLAPAISHLRAQHVRAVPGVAVSSSAGT